MTTLNKELLQVGTGANIRTFVEEGVHINRKPILEVNNYSIIGVLPNKEYLWDFSNINHDIIPYSLFAYKSTGINNNDSLIIKIRQPSNNEVIWQLELAGRKDVFGNAFAFTFPFIVVSKLHKASVTSSVSLDSLIVFGEKTFLNPTISPDAIL